MNTQQAPPANPLADDDTAVFARSRYNLRPAQPRPQVAQTERVGPGRLYCERYNLRPDPQPTPTADKNDPLPAGLDALGGPQTAPNVTQNNGSPFTFDDMDLSPMDVQKGRQEDDTMMDLDAEDAPPAAHVASSLRPLSQRDLKAVGRRSHSKHKFHLCNALLAQGIYVNRKGTASIVCFPNDVPMQSRSQTQPSCSECNMPHGNIRHGKRHFAIKFNQQLKDTVTALQRLKDEAGYDQLHYAEKLQFHKNVACQRCWEFHLDGPCNHEHDECGWIGVARLIVEGEQSSKNQQKTLLENSARQEQQSIGQAQLPAICATCGETHGHGECKVKRVVTKQKSKREKKREKWLKALKEKMMANENTEGASQNPRPEKGVAEAQAQETGNIATTEDAAKSRRRAKKQRRKKAFTSALTAEQLLEFEEPPSPLRRQQKLPRFLTDGFGHFSL